MTLDGLTLRGLVQELGPELTGSRVEGVYHPKPDLVTLHAWSPRDRQDRTLLIGTGPLPRWHLTRARFRNPPSPSSFCMLLRKHLKGGVIQAVAQAGLERIADVRIHRREARYDLRAELLGRHGALVLLRADSEPRRVLGALTASASRPLRPGVDYQAPRGQDKLDPRADGAREEFLSLARPAVSLWQWLLAHLEGVGPRLAKELALRAELDPQAKVATLSESDRSALWDAVEALFSVIPRGDWRPGVYGQDGAPLEAAPFPLRLYESLAWREVTSLSQAFDTFVEPEVFATQEDTLRARLLKRLGKEVRRTQAALDHVAADRRRAERYDQLKREADLILLHLSELAGRSGQVELVDPADGARVRLELDPRLSPVEAAQKRYARYKKLKRGLDKLAQRRRALELEREGWETAKVQVEQADTLSDLNALAQELGLEAVPEAQRRAEPDPPPGGPRRVECEGYVILIGKNGRQNDQLTRGARPEDLWLHARERPGSHVVVKSGGDAKAVPERVRLRAAQLAAYYSKGRGATKVPVICTRAKFLKKPRGAKPGLVLVTREEATLVVEPVDEEGL